ncbi:DNA polymerase delta subunit 2-like [Diaphorina citri]|uniref:DNA polymerase delta subunit 2 n=1 Tax=Diaphorina citri TaxID=121845 RepID=A0A1S3CYW6_DIACI|nr:DNA polymerase delta subunit 2-like [Diaphorina citri]
MKNIECKSYTRPTADYKNLSQCFRLASKDYSKQFAHIYAVRLNKMRECLLARVSQKWGKSVSVLKLSDLNETDTEECVIIGTLFKHQQLKPNILKEISEELKLVPQPQHTHFVSDSDELILEDELQRIPLHGNIDIHNQVTGVVVAIKGTPVGNGKFKVSDVCYATPVFKPRTTLSNNENKYVNHVDAFC